ncbi:hypothetical protein [Paenibacillus sp. HB172176]|uniref:DUF7309 domain-containing protein n=1 Tax=Paenibacillus sp. HB172176 TaxID=2493690 RepID=UPI0014396D78|nr:hypothetical protein [Paenibacillus sp. HB172176]
MNATLEQWKNLFHAAEQFKQAACWKWMDNSHLFGVEDPVSKEIGYCCIMGNGGEMYGIAVYRGTRGLDSYIEAASGGDSDDIPFTQDCLMLSFDSRDDLHPEEYKRIKELGLKFRGAHAWPTFRIYEPGYYPWPIEDWEHVQFLTHALQQAIEVSRDYRSDPDALHEPEDERILTRVSAEDGANLVWSDQWLTPKPEKNESKPEFKINELRLAKIRKSLEGITEAWVMDCFYMPFPVKEDGRPYFPMMFLLADRNSGQILHFHLFDGTAVTEEIAEQFLNLIEQVKVIPKEILIIRESAVEYLGAILDTLNIEVYVVEHEPLLEEIKNGLIGSFHQ